MPSNSITENSLVKILDRKVKPLVDKYYLVEIRGIPVQDGEDTDPIVSFRFDHTHVAIKSRSINAEINFLGKLGSLLK